MGKKLTLSPWHDGNVKPVHVGIYERNWRKFDSFYCSNPYYAFWDGRHWKESRTSISKALIHKNDDFNSWNDNLQWRGIIK